MLQFIYYIADYEENKGGSETGTQSYISSMLNGIWSKDGTNSNVDIENSTVHGTSIELQLKSTNNGNFYGRYFNFSLMNNITFVFNQYQMKMT